MGFFVVKRTHVESLLLFPRGYDLRYCLLTCLLLLRERNGVGLPPPPQPPSRPRRRGTPTAAARATRGGLLVSVWYRKRTDSYHGPPNPRGGCGTPVPRAPAWDARRRGRPVGVGGEPPRINAGTRHAPPPHSSGYTRVPPVLPGPGRDRDAPGGFGGTRRDPSPHSGGDTRVPPVLLGPRRERGAPWGFEDTRRVSSPTQRRLHPSPSGPAWAAEG